MTNCSFFPRGICKSRAESFVPRYMDLVDLVHVLFCYPMPYWIVAAIPTRMGGKKYCTVCPAASRKPRHESAASLKGSCICRLLVGKSWPSSANMLRGWLQHRSVQAPCTNTRACTKTEPGEAGTHVVCSGHDGFSRRPGGPPLLHMTVTYRW